MPYDIVKLKEQHRRDLAKLSFDEKIAVLIRMQKIARKWRLPQAGNLTASFGTSARVRGTHFTKQRSGWNCELCDTTPTS